MNRLCGLASGIAILLLPGFLAGCGGGAAATPIAAPSSSSLNGNWLITGSLPISGLRFPLPQQFGLALTLDVVNGQVIADVNDFYPCTLGAVGGGGGLAPATIAADGSFTLQTSQIGSVAPTVVFAIHGTVPKTAGVGWSGTYTATNSNVGCLPVAGTFTAVPISSVTGAFSGTGSLGAPNSGLVTAPTLSIAFQQGGPSSLDPPSGVTTANSVSALSGTITVGGSACFATGISAIPSGVVLGDDISAVFTMNDGSRLYLQGNIIDPAVMSIKLRSLLVNGGSCNGWFGSSGTVLTRQ